MKGNVKKYESVYATLREEIEAEIIKYDELLPSEREISERFGVDRTTVRRALELLVNDGLVEKRAGLGSKVILKQAGQSGSAPRPADGKIIGLFFPGASEHKVRMNQPFYSNLFYYMENECRKKGYRLVYTTLLAQNDLVELMRAYNFCGMVFVTKVPLHFVEQAKEAGMPCVTVHEKVDGVTCVTADNIGGGYRAAKYLLDRGHRSIGLITAPGYLTSQERCAGVLKAFQEQGLTFPIENIFEGNWEIQSGYNAAQAMLNRPPEHRPTALFSFNDTMCYGAIQALTDHGISVPDDISVIGFDNTSLHGYGGNITTMDSQVPQIAKVITDSLINIINQEIQYAVDIHVPVTLVERDSVKQLME